MKRLVALVLALGLLLCACGGGDVSEVGRRIGTCQRFTPAQIDDAMDEVERFFKAEYDGCKLILIEYDEEATAKAADAWSEQYGAPAIVLKSEFYVDGSGRSPALNPDSTYRNYSWILVKTLFGWELKDWGYG